MNGKELLKNKKTRLAIFSSIIVICFVFFLWVLNNYALDRPSFCTSCHLIQAAYDSWQKAQHKPEYTKNSCNVCHVQEGLVGPIKASVYGLESAYIYFFGLDEDDVKASKPVYCSRKGCHEQMEKSMIGKNIRVNHGLHMDMGYSCVICHDRVAHEEYAMAKNLSMMQDFCFPCHNDEVAPRNDCEICHIYQIQMLSGTETPGKFPKIVSPHYQEDGACQVCHISFDDSAAKTCLECHEENISREFQQFKVSYNQSMNEIKKQIEEAQSLFSQIKGVGSSWEQVVSLFEMVQKNYTYIDRDAGQGGHNQKLTRLMIDNLKKDIQKVRYFLYNYQSYRRTSRNN